jgi:hypothetical protein
MKTIYLALGIAIKLFKLMESAALEAAVLMALIYHLWQFLHNL